MSDSPKTPLCLGCDHRLEGGPDGFAGTCGTVNGCPHLHFVTRPAYISGAESSKPQWGHAKRIMSYLLHAIRSRSGRNELP